MRKPIRRIKCQVEALEDRQLPAVTVSLLNGGSTLSIKGDSASDAVTMTQNDANDQISVSWHSMGPGPQSDAIPIFFYQSSSIKKIVVSLGAGDDSFTYRLDGDTMQWAKTLSVDLGAGNDSAFLDFSGALMESFQNPSESQAEFQGPQSHMATLNANLSIDVQGGAGNDTIQSVFGNINQGLTYKVTGGQGNDTLETQVAGRMSSTSNSLIDQDGGAGNDQLKVDLGTVGIDYHGKVTVNQHGSQGNDQLTINANLKLMGALSVNQSGGAGDDTIDSHAQLEWSSTGSITARVNGDLGNDTMKVRIKRDDIPSDIAVLGTFPNVSVDSLINGGLGRNVSVVTPNVRTILTQLKNRSWDMG